MAVPDNRPTTISFKGTSKSLRSRLASNEHLFLTKAEESWLTEIQAPSRPKQYLAFRSWHTEERPFCKEHQEHQKTFLLALVVKFSKQREELLRALEKIVVPALCTLLRVFKSIAFPGLYLFNIYRSQNRWLTTGLRRNSALH